MGDLYPDSAPGCDSGFVWRYARGFTLIELVIVIALSGAVLALVTSIMTRPLEHYVDTSRRAELVDVAESALSMMARDVRNALPNSLRVTGSRSLEMVNVVSGARYRADPDGSGGGDILDFSVSDNSFDILGNLTVPTGSRLVIYNLGAKNSAGDPLPGANVYGGPSLGPLPVAGSHVISPAGTSISGGTSVTMNPAFQFSFSSPQRRVYAIDYPISYLCEGGEINRYWGYALQASQPVNGNAAPLSSANMGLLTDHVSSCSFVYDAGVSNEGRGLLTLSLSLSLEGETISLLHQIHVDNSP
ncbi:type II secretion system GspH family protein [Aestuariirhabdus sp. Z084]|uniref:PilW family protein n=1 Tax=Aestuariirhabdus haliotis TaxID=2918751 RepID=UPI00201B42FB|nr:type II secretion system protein [Aestuariirhabdus haliotis]MCL6414988.1 type II secretion system GspH family protein [Aestuariirhabdus haliotis]MCL6418920.1 type II secretion system GspH family protein [Aestuariirhabdus haliotis]